MKLHLNAYMKKILRDYRFSFSFAKAEAKNNIYTKFTKK